MFLRFYREIVEELLKDDGLLILASGLGILEILYKFVELHSNPKSLVFILNLSQNDIEFINMRLMTNIKTTHDIDQTDNKLFFDITGDISSQNRQNMYLSGGCIAITSRVLVADLLNNVIPFQSITGILVNNAYQLSKSANLSFVLEIFRKNNKKGFILGFSENAHKLCGGYATLRDIMKRLFVSKVTIWPRFRVSIEESLKEKHGSNSIDIVELHLKLTDSQRIIQQCIMEIIEGLLNELKKTTFVQNIKITIENGLFNDFDYKLYIAFKPYWNKLSKKTKNLISDLINLKRLLSYILSYDSITFYRHLLSIKRTSIDKITNIPKAIWLYTDSAEKLFCTSKNRVYKWYNNNNNNNNNIGSPPNKKRKLSINNNNNNNNNNNGDIDDGILDINLEVNRKWTVLINVLNEIRKLQSEHSDILSSPILIICKSKSVSKQLSHIICNGPNNLMNKYWNTYLSHISHFNQINNNEKINNKQKETNCLLTEYQKIKDKQNKQSYIDHYFSLNGDLDINENGNNNDNKNNNNNNNSNTNDPFIDLTNEENKHQQDLLTAFEGNNGKYHKFYKQTNDDMDYNGTNSKSPSPKNKNKTQNKTQNKNKNKNNRNGQSESEKQQFAFGDSLDQLCAGLSDRKYINNQSKIIIHAMDEGDNDLLLWQIKPEFVILYDNTLSFIRKLEVFHSYYNKKNLRVYLLSYTSSIEEQIYLSNIRREKESFLKLINEKSEMILPKNINGKIDKSILKLPSQQSTKIESKRSQINNKFKKVKNKIIVDLREFRSSTNLPLLLYRENINVIPVTLKVGDYILSPSLCVERKCISDLFSSIIHGRLYDQILQITRYYEIAILLIEFNENKSFSLQNMKDIPQNINLTNIISKLVILTIHFNKLTILWSRCPLVTTKIFKTLKSNRDEPDLNTSITITNRNDNDIDGDDDNEDMHTPKDILRSLPGVNHKNVHKILNKCESLKDLCSKSKEEIFEILGVKDGQLLYQFLHTNFFND